MKAAMYGLPVEGLHLFRGDSATMQIKLASLFQVVDAKGPEMNQGETVTLFNDMCLLAPAALIDKQRIQWEADGPLAARARFTHMGNTISARLSFNQAGELIDFVSNDRFLSADGKTFKSYPWSTPVRSYREFGGRRVASYGEAVWHTPEGEFTYGKFNLVEIEYNLAGGDSVPARNSWPLCKPLPQRGDGGLQFAVSLLLTRQVLSGAVLTQPRVVLFSMASSFCTGSPSNRARPSAVRPRGNLASSLTATRPDWRLTTTLAPRMSCALIFRTRFRSPS